MAGFGRILGGIGRLARVGYHSVTRTEARAVGTFGSGYGSGFNIFDPFGDFKNQRMAVFRDLLSSAPLGLQAFIFTPDGVPLLLDYLLRAQASDDFIASYLENFLDDPGFYKRPDRMAGETSVEKGGTVVNWGPGYGPYNAIRRGGDGDTEITSTRPYHPEIDPAAIHRMAGDTGKWITDPSSIARRGAERVGGMSDERREQYRLSTRRLLRDRRLR